MLGLSLLSEDNFLVLVEVSGLRLVPVLNKVKLFVMLHIDVTPTFTFELGSAVR